MSTNQALAKVGNNLAGFADYLNSKKSNIAMVCARHMDPDRICRIVMNCVTRTPQLRSCTTVSIFRSVMQAAELGLEPGSALGEAYLVPYKDQCQLIPGYRGLVTLARRSGEIANVWAEAVYEGDEFKADYGLHPDLVHIPKFLTQDPKKILFAYACARFRSGETQFVVMPKIEIDRISGGAASKNGPWSNHYAEMAKKTAVKRLCKMLPMSVEMAKAVKLDNAFETGDFTDVEFDAVEAIPDPEEVAVATAVDEPPARGTNAVKEKLQQQAAKPAAPAEPELTPRQQWDRIYAAAKLPAGASEEAKVLAAICKRPVGQTAPPTEADYREGVAGFGDYIDQLTQKQPETAAPAETQATPPAEESADEHGRPEDEEAAAAPTSGGMFD